MVGDAKQAIYRWRNGDHRQLGPFPTWSPMAFVLSPALQDAAGQMRDSLDRRRIVENWRSAPQIVDFNNRIYPTLAEGLEPDLAEVYGDVAQDADEVVSGWGRG